MAYTTPKRWTFQEQLSVYTHINALSTNNDALLAESVLDQVAASAMVNDSKRVTFCHSLRYLYYFSPDTETEGMIYPWPYRDSADAEDNPIGEPMSLPNTKVAGGGFVDLDEEVGWLVPGMYYCVEGVAWAFEVEVER